MAKYIKPSIADGISFAFELYKRIPVGRKVTAQELKTELEHIGIKRDIRTIQRNLDVIVRYFDVEKDIRDKPYGYSKRSNIKRSLGAREAITLALAEEYLRSVLPPELMSSIESTFMEAQILATPIDDKERARQLQKVHVLTDSYIHTPPRIPSTLYEMICIALHHNRWLTLMLKPESGAKTNGLTFEAMPLGLTLSDNSMSLIYQRANYQTPDNIALTGLHQVRVSTYTFSYPNDFNIKVYTAEKQASNKEITHQPRVSAQTELKINCHEIIDKAGNATS